jgi:serine/threonine-protein kinase
MATVYFARDRKLTRPVAVKVLRPELTDLLGRERFLREIDIAASLQHPNILPVYDSGACNGLLFYVMPYVAGESLRDRLDREKQLSLEDALRICREVADALGYAHTRGIVHRDVKPANILLGEGHALVADFGIARAVGDADATQLTERGIAVGTPAYMSPEQASGGDVVDGRTDLYALGCVLYEMLTGEPPFSGPTTQAILARHRFDPVPPLRSVRPSVPIGVEAAILHTLEKVPADRFATATRFVEALAAPRAPSLWQHRRLAAVLVLAVLALTAVLGRVVWRGFKPHVETGDLSRIAVLYFDDASPDSSLRWLAQGLTEDLIDALSAVHGLTVTSRNGVRPFAGHPAAPDSIGRKLGVGLLVDAVVEPTGSAADSVRVSVRLVDASNAVLLERLTLARSLREPLGLRRDLTAEMEQLLRRRIGAQVRLRQERHAAGNDVAWEDVRRARELRSDATTLVDGGDLRGAAIRFSRADSLLQLAEFAAPNWSQPEIERADLSLMKALIARDASMRDTTLLGGGVTSLLLAGSAHINRALRRAPDDPRALALHGEIFLRLWGFGELNAKDSLISVAYRDLARATELDPDQARAWYTLSEVLKVRGSPEQSRLAAQKALEADVYAAQAPAVILRLLYSALDRGAAGEADSLCAVDRRYYPSDPNSLECPLTILGWFGRGMKQVDSGWALVRQLDTVSAVASGRLPRRLLVAAVLARSGLSDSARAVLSSTRALAPNQQAWDDLAVYEAYVRVLAGEHRRPMELLQRMVAEDPENRGWLARHPWFQPLKDDPAFRRLTHVDQ